MWRNSTSTDVLPWAPGMASPATTRLVCRRLDGRWPSASAIGGPFHNPPFGYWYSLYIYFYHSSPWGETGERPSERRCPQVASLADANADHRRGHHNQSRGGTADSAIPFYSPAFLDREIEKRTCNRVRMVRSEVPEEGVGCCNLHKGKRAAGIVSSAISEYSTARLRSTVATSCACRCDYARYCSTQRYCSTAHGTPHTRSQVSLEGLSAKVVKPFCAQIHADQAYVFDLS